MKELMDFRITDGELRHLGRTQVVEIFDKILSSRKRGSNITVRLDSLWTANIRWAGNRVVSSGDVQTHTVTIETELNGARGLATTNRLDDISLSQAVYSSYEKGKFGSEAVLPWYLPSKQKYLQPVIWSDDTYSLDSRARAQVAREMIEIALASENGSPVGGKRLSAGYLEVKGGAASVMNSTGLNAFADFTRVECSVTTRTRGEAGIGSGWAGVLNYDWKNIDCSNLAQISRYKCLSSVNPVAVEPGRYTAILEPQAVYDIISNAVEMMDRYGAESMRNAYALKPDQSRIGLRVFDPSITIKSSPLIKGAEYVPFDNDGYPQREVTWVENGYLRHLGYPRHYGVRNIHDPLPLNPPRSFLIEGGSTSVKQMIEDTRRGLLVTRFSGIRVLDQKTFMSAGYTRDGIWLVENGEIKYPVKNFRVLDSPMFVFNSVSALSPAVPVYGKYPAVVPAALVENLNFASLVDSI